MLTTSSSSSSSSCILVLPDQEQLKCSVAVMQQANGSPVTATSQAAAAARLKECFLSKAPVLQQVCNTFL